MAEVHPLVAALVAEQEREGLSDGRMADALGIPRPTISRLKRGLVGPGRRVQDRILARYPHLLGYVLPVAGGVAEGGRGTAGMRAPPS